LRFEVSPGQLILRNPISNIPNTKKRLGGVLKALTSNPSTAKKKKKRKERKKCLTHYQLLPFLSLFEPLATLNLLPVSMDLS
jgi:hypothetical protein